MYPLQPLPQSPSYVIYYRGFDPAVAKSYRSWLQHCSRSQFCRQSQWIGVGLILITLLTIFSTLLCFFRLSSSGKRRISYFYCLIQVLVVATLLVVVGSMLSYIARIDREVVAKQMSAANSNSGGDIAPLVSNNGTTNSTEHTLEHFNLQRPVNVSVVRLMIK